MQYLRDGKKIGNTPSEAIFADAFAIARSPIAEDASINIFSTEKNFRQWADASPAAERFAKVRSIIETVNRYENQDNAPALSRQRVLSERMKGDMEELAARLKLDVKSDEFLKIAREGVSIMEPPVLGSALLYDTTFDSEWIPILNSVPYVDLGALRFSNRASAARLYVGGVLALWDRTWFKGTPVILPAAGLHDLADYGMNNKASSAFLA